MHDIAISFYITLIFFPELGAVWFVPFPATPIRGKPKFWQAKRPPLFRPRVGVKSELPTKILASKPGLQTKRSSTLVVNAKILAW
jgi:hypothetical protein